ncbi:NAD(P)/FAD-dependent oxidoreductase [Rhodococcus koreensis]
MSQNTPLVIIGASLAGLRAAEEARFGGYSGPIIMVGAEPHLPYDRPPLSKQFILNSTNAADFLTSEDELLSVLNVDLRLGRTAIGLDVDARRVRLDDETLLDYGTLIVATGAAPRMLPSAPELDGIFTLRTVDDAAALRDRIVDSTRVVVIGAGFIGSEIASSAHHLGAEVTLLEGAPVPLVRAVGPVVGLEIASLHQRNGVDFRLSTAVQEIIGKTRVEGVRLTSGEVLPADVIVIGVGAAPATSWLADSGVRLDPVDGGIVCDEYLRTSAEDVFAAGDVAHWPNELLGSGSMRLENWTNAADQGRHAARNALWPDSATPYVTVPYFWSDWYGQRIQFVGTAAPADEVRFVDGESGTDRWTALFRSGDRIIAAATLNEPRRIMKYRKLIGRRAAWSDAMDAFPQDASRV